MAARLKWGIDSLFLGTKRVGEIRPLVGGCWRYAVTETGKMSEPYERMGDAQQDLESEVRRLLKEAGVDCE